MFKLKAVLVVCVLSTGLAACQSAPGGSAGAGTSNSGAAATPTPKPAPLALEKPTYTVARGPVADELKLTGRVAATLDQDLFFVQDGFLKTLYIDRTDVVTKGQLLAELDLGTLPNEQRQAEVALSSAELNAQTKAAQQQFAIRKAQLDLDDARAKVTALKQPPLKADLDAASLAIQQAKLDLEDVRHKSSTAKTQAEFAVDQAANTVRDKQADYARIVELNGTRPPEQLQPDQLNAQEAAGRAVEDAQTALAAAKVAYEQAKQDEINALAAADNAVKNAQIKLDGLLAGPTKIELADAQRGVTRAQVALEEAQAGGVDPDDQKAIEQARLNLENINARLEAGRIYAPFDGEVADISIRPGDGVTAYKAIMNIINPTNTELVVDSTLSSDLAKIGVGQQVSVAFARYATTVLSGTVEQLPTSLTSTASSVQADPAIHISFDPSGLDLEIGDLANLVLTLERKDNALWLPPQAVRSFDGRRFVVVQDGTRQRRVDVKVGIISTGRIEILEGLNEGDVVIGQ